MFKRLLPLFLLAGVAFAQPPTSVSILGPAPGGVTFGSAAPSPSSPGGGQTMFYYVIARYPSGLAYPTSAIVARNTAGIGNLSASNFNVVSWSAVSGATGYDVVRQATQTSPNSPCTACAVVLNTTATSVNDTGQNGGNYPPAGIPSVQDVTDVLQVDNTSSAAVPFLTSLLTGLPRRRVGIVCSFTNGAGVAFDANGCLIPSAGSAGTVTSITVQAPLTGTPNPITTTGTIAADTTILAQKFFGSGAPGSVANNLPGDTYTDSVSHTEYYCAKAAGTAAPACTAVGAGNWTANGTGSVTSVTCGNRLTGGTITTTGTCGADTTVLAQKFFGSGAPGSVAGNLPGDTYTDSVSHIEYYCAAAAGTGAPACTGVGAGNWTVPGSSSAAAADPYITIDGSNFFAPVFAATKPPACASLTAVNQGSSTCSTLSSGAIVIDSPPSGGADNIRFYRLSAYPATPFTFTIGFVPTMPNADFQESGITISDGTKFADFSLGRISNIAATSYTHATATSSGTQFANVPVVPPSVWFVSLTDDGTNLTMKSGATPNTLVTVLSSTRAAMGITPTQLGVAMNPQNGVIHSAMEIFHWLVQ